jgi:hypothetical protein
MRGVYRRLSFPEESTQRHDGHAVIDICDGLVNVNRIHHQPGMTSGQRNIGGSKPEEEEEEENPMHEALRSTEASDQAVPIDWQSDREPKWSG